MNDLPAPPPELPPQTSLLARMLNIFATPGDVFDEVRTAKPATGNWLGPLLLLCLAALVFTFVAFSQESVMKGIRDQQAKAMQAQVKAGTLTQAQADQAAVTMENFMGPKMMMIFGSVGAVLGNIAYLVIAALLVWLIGARALKAPFDFQQALQICGLATMINVLGIIVMIFLTIATGNMMITLGPALALREFDATQPLHRLASMVNVIALWHVALVSLGLAKFTGVTFARAAAWVFGLWLVFIGLMSLVKWG